MFRTVLLSIIRNLDTVFTTTCICHTSCVECLLADSQHNYRGADKSLARPGRKQAIATKDFYVHVSYLLSQLEEY
jgi:hypothetical protein